MVFYRTMPLLILATVSLLVRDVYAACPSIEGLGVSGGSGPRGGIGDGAHPVLKAQSFVTDALIPDAPNTTKQLAHGPPPILRRRNGTQCAEYRRVVIDNSPKGARQEMLGFGHAWTDSTVSTLGSLEPDLLDQVLEELFGQTGNNMGFMRHTIGSSDLSGNQYSYDDNGPSFNEGEPDPDLSSFGLGPDGTAMAELIARMGNYKGDVFLFGSPWSYPGWTKRNGLFIAPNLNVDGGGSYNILNNSFDVQYIPQMVEYFSKYVDVFKEHGVNINGITPENEPLNYQGGYPCMYLDAAEEGQLLAHGLGDAMHERGVKILAYDHNTDQPVYPARVIQTAPGMVDAAAWHCYASPVANYSVMDDFSYAYPETLQFMTECSNYLPEVGSYNFIVATSFTPPVQHGASGAAMWVMATDPDFGPHSPYGGCAGCLGSIVVNSSMSYTKTNDYYMIGQFTRFIRRGSVNYRVLAGNEGSALTDAQFYIIAVQNPDQSWAVVFMNNIGDEQNIELSFTDSGTVWEGTVPNGTVTTWLLPADKVLPKASPLQAPPYPMSNASMPMMNATGTGTGTAADDCGRMTTSSSSSSSSGSSTTPLIPVPNTTHTISSSSA